MERNRNHEYVYSVGVRHELDKPVTDDEGNVKKDSEGNPKTYHATEWIDRKVRACDIREAADKLHLKLDDVRYYHKEIIK